MPPVSLRLEDHVFQMMENAYRMAEVIGNTSWMLDVPTQRLTLTRDDTGQVVAMLPVQLVGSQSDETQTFLWAWANAASNLPPAILQSVTRLRELAETEGQREPFLIENPFPLPFPDYGMAAAMICAGVTGGFGAYRCPYDGGAAYVVIERFPEAEAVPPHALRASKAITGSISAFSLAHYDALKAYLGEPDASGVFVGRGLRVRLDAQERVGNIEFTMGPDDAAALNAARPADAPPLSALDKIKGLFGGGNR